MFHANGELQAAFLKGRKSGTYSHSLQLRLATSELLPVGSDLLRRIRNLAIMPNYLVMELRYRDSGEVARAHQQGQEGIPGHQ